MRTTDTSTTSTTYVLLEGMSLTITTTGGDVLIHFATTTSHSRNGRRSDYAVFVDGTQQFAVGIEGHAAGDKTPVALSYLATGLTAASHTFQVRWRISNADTTLSQSAAAWGLGRGLTVFEMR